MAEAIKGCGCVARQEIPPLDDSKCRFAEAKADAERLESAKVAIRAELAQWPDAENIPQHTRDFRREYRGGLEFALSRLGEEVGE